MKYRITATLNKVGSHINLNVIHEYTEEETKLYLEKIYLSILHSLKEADKKAFYCAMAEFADEDYDDAKEFIKKELRHEN